MCRTEAGEVRGWRLEVGGGRVLEVGEVRGLRLEVEGGWRQVRGWEVGGVLETLEVGSLRHDGRGSGV